MPCSHEGSDGENFCRLCGAALVRSCPSCDAPALIDAIFCSKCGSRLVLESSAATPTAEAAVVHTVQDAAGTSHAGGERRQLTVLFCDLVGSADLGARVDAEVFHEIVDAYYQVCGEAIARYDGHIANYLGDGIVALFGYPIAHEDSADGAVRAGLAVHAALAAGERAEMMHGERIAARVGIHTGLVVVNIVGGDARREIHALGDAVNTAARVQGTADPRTVVLTEATRRLMRAPFKFTDRGLVALKGIPQPVALSQVDSEIAIDFDDADSGTKTAAENPFVGRLAEREQIATSWSRARLGSGRAVLVRGEAGIGKSRLVAEARIDLGGDDHRWIGVHASRVLSSSAFILIGEVIRRMLAWGPDTDPELAAKLLHRSLDVVPHRAPDTEFYLRDLLGLRTDDDAVPVISKEQQRRRTIAVCVAWINAQSRERKTVIVVEDLHWADPSSVEVLRECVNSITAFPLLMLFTARPEFQPPWGDNGHHTTLSLQRLDGAEIRELIRDRIDSSVRSKELVEALATRSDGIPLFAEELAIAYADTALDSAATIPATLYDSLMARLDRLSRAKPLAQHAAVLGREFYAADLRAIVSYSPDEFAAGLLELVAADLISIEQLASDMRCEFKHALVQQAAYDSLLHRNRSEIHGAIAEMMLESHELETHPHLAVVAHHLSESHQIEQAISAWERAANRAAATSANREAVGLYDAALELLARLPESPERMQREITMLLNQLSFHFMIEGPTGPNSLSALARMRMLSSELPRDGFHHIDVLANSIGFVMSKGDLVNAKALADEFFAAAVESGNEGVICQAHIALASVASNVGQLRSAVDHARVAIDHVGPYDHPIGVQTSRSFALLYGGVSACMLGDLDIGLSYYEELYALATGGNNDPISALLAKVGACVVSMNLRSLERVAVLAAEIEEAGRLFGLDTLTGWGCIYGGWARALLAPAGSPDAIAGAETAKQGLGIHIETRQDLGIAQTFALVAEAHLHAGLGAEGIAMIDDALSRADHRELHPYTIELRLTRARLHDAVGNDDEMPASNNLDARSVSSAEDDFLAAIALALELDVRLYELRVRTSYAKWLGSNRREQEGIAQLEPIFTAMQHHDVADVEAARMTLSSLKS